MKYILVWENNSCQIAWICLLKGDSLINIDFIPASDMIDEEFLLADHDTEIFGFLTEMELIDEL